jgi:SAM-dependent methyltransferase
VRSPFDALVDSYDAARPAYPDGLYDALPRLDGALVADVGSGTGIATRGMLARGADVVAYDLGEQMLRRLVQRGSPGPGSLSGAVVADGHALPARDGTFDLVTYAQAFHWMRHGDAAREAKRVLKDHGALAVWWNNSAARDQPWWIQRQEMLERLNEDYEREYRDLDPAPGLREVFGSVETYEVSWLRRVPIDDYLVFLASTSYVAALGERLDGFLDAQRTVLAETFGDGPVEEPYVTRLWLAR